MPGHLVDQISRWTTDPGTSALSPLWTLLASPIEDRASFHSSYFLGPTIDYDQFYKFEDVQTENRSSAIEGDDSMLRIGMIFLTTLWSGVASAQSSGEPEAGKLLANQYCARCHDVSSNGAFKQIPPSFAAIAVYWGDDQIWNRIMFPVHTSMPSMWEFLNPDSVRHVTAYIRSLEE